MIPLKTLYDEHIDRRKLTELRKPVELIVPPPQNVVGTVMLSVTNVLVTQSLFFFQFVVIEIL